MLFVEMSRDLEHGGEGWEFPTCLWAPTQKEKGGTWPFWEAVGATREGDLVLHLRGEGKAAKFVGFSRISAPGYRTNARPPHPNAWSWSGEFFRADLTDFVPLVRSLSLPELFQRRRTELEAYFMANKAKRGDAKRHIFYVIQAGRLQCLNGAYLSEADEELLGALFGDEIDITVGASQPEETVPVGTQLRQVLARVGQREFSGNVREAYGNRCCFPGCNVEDPRFLVGSHIARWADNEALRGAVGNGLCLCLNHDRAFELGLFWLRDDLHVAVDADQMLPKGDLGATLKAARGAALRPGSTPPLLDAVREHRKRVGR